MLLLSSADLSLIFNFQKEIFQENYLVSSVWDQDLHIYSFGTKVGPNCLQRTLGIFYRDKL